jgi:predicted lipoprotein with Yx(FWY)xxD motif
MLFQVFQRLTKFVFIKSVLGRQKTYKGEKCMNKFLVFAILSVALMNNSYAKNTGIQEPISIGSANLGVLSSFETEGRLVLTDTNQISLYTFDQDDLNTTTCFDSCLNIWPPFTVENECDVSEPFGVIERPDSGQLQVTINGLPLYYFFRDQNPGDLNGEYPDWRPIPVQ